jgi:molecular chaperone GrpE
MTSEEHRDASAATPDDASTGGPGFGEARSADVPEGVADRADPDREDRDRAGRDRASRGREDSEGRASGTVADGAVSENGLGSEAGTGEAGDVAAGSDPMEPVGDNEAAEQAQEPDLGEDDPMAVLMHERDDYKDALMRLQADFENYKKRMIKQQTDHLERAAESLVGKLLPVLDTADLALAHGGGEDVKQISAALFSVLEREGLERIDPDGGPFDPTHHDAVAHEPGDGDQQVVEVLRAGYRWKGRVLRPAMVKVRG